MAKCNPVFIVTLPSEKVRDEAGVRGWDREVVGRWEREVDLVHGGALVCIIVAIDVFAQGGGSQE